jgi:CO/xanthine dehydrogenase FAD-binding subunit
VNTTHHNNEISLDDYPLDTSKQSLVISMHTTLQAVHTSPHTPALIKHSFRRWTTWQERVGITVEQAILSPNVAPQWIAALLSWGTYLKLTTDDDRCIPLADLFRGAGPSPSRPSHLLIPIQPPGRRWGEASVAPTPSDQPIVTAFAVVDMEKDIVRSARLALTGIWRETVRLAKASDQLAGKPLTKKNILQVVEAIQDEAQPQDTWRAGADYRQSMAGLTTRRAFEQCMTGEKGQ